MTPTIKEGVVTGLEFKTDNVRSIALAHRLGAGLDRKIDFMGGETLQYRHPLAG